MKLSNYRKQLRQLGQEVEGSDEDENAEEGEVGSENVSQNDVSEASSYVV